MDDLILLVTPFSSMPSVYVCVCIKSMGASVSERVDMTRVLFAVAKKLIRLVCVRVCVQFVDGHVCVLLN